MELMIDKIPINCDDLKTWLSIFFNVNLYSNLTRKHDNSQPFGYNIFINIEIVLAIAFYRILKNNRKISFSLIYNLPNPINVISYPGIHSGNIFCPADGRTEADYSHQCPITRYFSWYILYHHQG